MIVRDEEHNLASSLVPLVGLFDEMVVADTGSKDRTREVAANLGARVFDVPWSDDFSAARNAALDRATGAWAFRLDADDHLDQAGREALRSLLANLPNYPDGFAVRYTHDFEETPVTLDEVRLFPIRKDIRWQYRVHEQISPGIVAAGGSLRRTNVCLHHHGYRDPVVVRRKLERNLHLLELDMVDRPEDPFVLFYTGWTRMGLGDTKGATAGLREACRVATPDFSLLPLCYTLLSRAYLTQRELPTALSACRAGRTFCPRDAELACLEGELLLASEDMGAAAVVFRELLVGEWKEDYRFVGVRGPRARHGLATALSSDRIAEREALWREAIAERPDFGPAWLGLGESLISRGLWPEAARVIGKVEDALPSGIEGSILRARLAVSRGDYRGGKRELKRVCMRVPQAALPRVVLAQILLLEGRDRGAAARAIDEALIAEPGNPEANRLLRLLARWPIL